MIEVNKLPSQFRVFKKRSAMRVQLDKPVQTDRKYEVGCLFLQAAPANGGNGTENGYAWEDSKISVKMGFNDISSILHGMKMNQEVSLYHTYNEDKKSIKFSPKEGGGYFLSIEHTRGETKNSVSVPLSDEEIGSFITMLTFSLPIIHNWI